MVVYFKWEKKLKLVNCVYLEKNGRSQARDFINSLDTRTQRKFFAKKKLLEEFGFSLPEPHAKYVGDGIFELRFIGIEGKIRILYFFFHKNMVIFSNGFVKKSKKLPKHDLEIAINNKKAFFETHKEEN